MVHFFGIFDPGRRRPARETPGKVNFFGGVPDPAWGAVPLSRAEQDACYLRGKAPEPEPQQDEADCRRDGRPER